MTIRSRRVVTGLNAEGRSCILHNDRMDELSGGNRPLVWITPTIPANNEGSEDAGSTPVSHEIFSNGSGFLMLSEMQPGEDTPMHATNTLDFVIVLKGHVRLSLEEGDVVMGPGDIIVDRGVAHKWTVVGDEPMQLAAIVMPADPLKNAVTRATF